MIFDHPRLRDALGGRLAERERHRNVRRAVQHQGRHLDRGELWAEVGSGESIDAADRRRHAGLHGQASDDVDHLLRDRIGRRPLGVEEDILQQAAEIGFAVALHALLDAFEYRAIDADRIALGLQQIIRGRADKAGLCDVASVVPREIAHDLTATHGIADERCVPHTGLLDHSGEIVGKGIEIVAGGRLRRAAEAAAIVGDDAEAGLRERGGLKVPDVGVQRPGMGHDDGAAGAARVLDENPVPSLVLILEVRLWPRARRGKVTAVEAAARAPRESRRNAAVRHGQAPLFRGARYGGLTLRQSQAAFSYMPAPQNWQAILHTIPGHISRRYPETDR